MQVALDLVLFARTWEHIPGFWPEVSLTVWATAQLQRDKVVQLVIVDAARNSVSPHESVFHRIGVLEWRSDGRRVPSATDGISDVALRNSWIERLQA